MLYAVFDLKNELKLLIWLVYYIGEKNAMDES